MLNFNDFISEKLDVDADIPTKIENSNPEFVTNLIDKFTFLVTKRSVKSLRPIKISGYIKKPEGNNFRNTLNITMSNKDVIVGTYESGNIAISINTEIIYDIDREDFDENKLVDKLSDEYVKYLKNKNYKVKKNS
jgi:hypothetical protein